MRLKRMLREPLLHFLLLGATLFVVEAATRDEPRNDTRTIVISPDFVSALSRRAETTGDADPEGLVRAYVRDEALFREAKLLGLDQGDTIVRRRLVQKMEFLLQGLTDVPEPDDDALHAFVDAHEALFEASPRLSFDEVFFARSPSADAHARAVIALQQLASATDAGTPRALGDPRPGGYGAQGVTQTQLEARRSGEFAIAVFEAPEGHWSGPIDAALGSHLVRVTQRMPAQVPALDAIRARATQAFLQEARAHAVARAVGEVVARYRVERLDAEPTP